MGFGAIQGFSPPAAAPGVARAAPVIGLTPLVGTTARSAPTISLTPLVGAAARSAPTIDIIATVTVA